MKRSSVYLIFIISIVMVFSMKVFSNSKDTFLPHEDFFYTNVYNHSNVDLVYDYDIIDEVYTSFEQSVPTIRELVKNQGNINIKWNKVKNAQSYSIERRINKGTWTQLGETTKTYFLDKKMIIKGQQYSYRIKAVKKVKGRIISSKVSAAKKIKY